MADKDSSTGCTNNFYGIDMEGASSLMGLQHKLLREGRLHKSNVPVVPNERKPFSEWAKSHKLGVVNHAPHCD